MNHTMFKLSVISSALLAATQVSAALYTVVEVDSGQDSDVYQSSFGVAIEPASVANAADNCFVTGTLSDGTLCDSYILAGETRFSKVSSGVEVDGLSYREEAPFGSDNRFSYIQELGDFENYCDAQLGYSTCEQWASVRWGVWSAELNGDTTPNSVAFLSDGSLVDTTGTLDVVVNSISPNGTAIGIDSTPGNVTGYRRNSVTARTEGTVPSGLQTRAWKTDGTYTVGSISTSYGNDYGTYYTSKAAIWDNSGNAVEIPWASGRAERSDRLAQGSLRDFVINEDTIYAVGYNTYDGSYNYMNATVFKAPVADYLNADAWTSVVVDNARVRISGDSIHSNSVVTDVNDNLIAIGSAKRLGNSPYSGAAGNRLFIINDVTSSSLTAQFPSGGILFEGAGGKAGAINNYNEIVGQIDFEDTREIDGKPRVKRGFIYPYNDASTSDSDRMNRFANQAWYLDDLTNDDSATSNNNQFRVIDATDINDAGVVSGTALKCDGGYSTTAHNATCDGTETTVAVKLVPIVAADSSNIIERETDSSTSERSGGSLGLWGFILLGLGWFRRK